jgi:hypothetical protein
LFRNHSAWRKLKKLSGIISWLRDLTVGNEVPYYFSFWE